MIEPSDLTNFLAELSKMVNFFLGIISCAIFWIMAKKND